MLMLLVVSAACYLRAKKNERDRTVTFSTNAQDSAKKTYRDGVEVKPSDLGSSKGQIQTRINDSVVEDQDNSMEQEEQLLDNEDEK